MSIDTTAHKNPVPEHAAGEHACHGPGSPAEGAAGQYALATASEIEAARGILERAGLWHETTRIAYLGLVDPPRGSGAGEPGAAVDRRFRVFLHDVAGARPHDVTLSVTRGEVDDDTELDTSAAGELPVLEEEFEAVEEILGGDARWLEALAARGLDPATVRVAPLSAGVFEYPEEKGRRILRGLAFVQEHASDSPWAHPVDGLVAYVDVVNRTVDQVLDFGPVPVPAEHGNFTDPELTGPVRGTQKPIEITQPDGPSFTVTGGNHVEWERWSLDVGFDVREGLVLHNIAFDDAAAGNPGDRKPTRRRRILDRASIAEMVVPYGDPSPVRSWQNYFDTGEYLVGQFANSLELGCDCLGEITYLSPVVADGFGTPRTIANGICMHEEDASILSKHSDLWSGVSYVRRNRRLVISFFTTIGNYDYGFYWYLYLDGTIEFEAKATGVVFTSAQPSADYPYSSEMAPGLGAPFHQHLFSARLDFALDSGPNRVEEEDAVRVPLGPGNERGNAFTRRRTLLARESQAARENDMAAGRSWVVSNPGSLNRLGEPVAYKIHPQGQPTLLADPASSVAGRAAFATKALWVTRYDEAERYPTGDFVNQHPGGAGLPAYQTQDRDLDGTDLVVWHTFGLTHFPRPEDWPIMPVDHVGFKIRPEGFFDRSPVLDVPAPAAGGGHCHR
ncbi:histamine oxidase [Sinomonas atrocyanea]|uniref:Amine oxidase n=1 Tax=Sinomonas atrocyanea TaxID=37927 RepID=A0A127A1G2_9MICC|nr:primary-amine oxidase [Sinomonas atrocyanea]AMM33153.1 histamine oxidase [Sinomonas atrocyanea]GEB63966.1 amine oxidase [Sinomonas atrocyanea]GGG76606.1 amine oxidase [Sinomonas atrocyanea]